VAKQDSETEIEIYSFSQGLDGYRFLLIKAILACTYLMKSVKGIYTQFFFIRYWSVLCFIILLNFSPAQGQTIETIKEEIASYFKPIKGEIISQEGNDLIINRGKRDGLKKGMRFTVFRKGEPFFHPVTREFIGNIEHVNGLIEVIKVAHQSARARILSQNPLPGDMIRITSAPIKLAFFQQKDAHWAIADAVYNSLKNSGRFVMLETYTSSYKPEDLSAVAQKLGADAFLVLLTSGHQKTSQAVDVNLYWVEETIPFARVQKIVDVKSLKVKETLIPLRTGDNEPMFSTSLPGGELIAMGDVDGNGDRDIVISDREKIWIYTYDNGLKEKWVHDLDTRGKHLSLDILDINKNGKDEIFITSLKNEQKLTSFVIEYEELEGFRIINENIPYFFRVTDTLLLMQGFSKEDGFSGPVYECIFEKGQYKPGRMLELPDNITIYGFTYLNSTDTKSPVVFYLDDTGRINLYEKGKRFFKSSTKYSALSFSFDVDRGMLRSKKTSLIKGGITPVRTKSGTKVLIIHNEPVLPKMKGLGSKRSRLYALFWDGSTMQQKEILSNIRGRVIDYFLDGETLFILANPTLYMYAKKALSGDIPHSVILYIYKIAIQ
jgi:hypothetical protein